MDDICGAFSTLKMSLHCFMVFMYVFTFRDGDVQQSHPESHYRGKQHGWNFSDFNHCMIKCWILIFKSEYVLKQ